MRQHLNAVASTAVRTTFCIGLALSTANSLAGCTGDTERTPDDGVAGAPGGNNNGGSGASSTSAGGQDNSDASGGMTGSVEPMLRYGEVLELVPGSGDVPYAIGDNPYGIHGGAFLARSALGNTITVGAEPGQICISGNLEEVPNGNYGQYWGVEIGFNLNQNAATNVGADAGSVAPADAGPAADAGADVAEPWLPGNVIGFSFVIEGPTINLIRFKALPAGYDPMLESSVFCKAVNATSAESEDALFTELLQNCWNASASVLVPTGEGLSNISWQLPADVAVGARPFEWCLKELRPILGDEL